MGTTRVETKIEAPPAEVFDAVAHIDNFSDIVDAVTNVEFLSEERRGVGTRFRETRVVKGREGTSVLEVTEYRSGEHLRVISDEGGTVWDTVFTVAPDGDGTLLTMAMDAKPHKFAARVMNPFIGPMIRKAIESDMAQVKAHCEAAPGVN